MVFSELCHIKHTAAFVLKLTLIACSVCQLTAQPAWDDLALPPGATGEIISYNGNQQEVPFDKILFSVSRNWVRSIQYIYQNDLGWSMFDFTQDTFDKSVLYHPDSLRGTIDTRLDIMGYSRADLGAGPIGWIRTLHVLADQGQTIKSTQVNGQTVYSANMALEQGVLRVFVDSQGRVPRVELDNPETPKLDAVYTYDNWQPIGTNGKLYPHTIHSLLIPPSGPPSKQTGILKSIKPLPLDADPPPLKFPKNALFADNIEHVTRNGAMEVTGKLVATSPTQSTNPAALTRSTLLGLSKRTWLVVLAVALFVLAAIVREVRRRKAHG